MHPAWLCSRWLDLRGCLKSLHGFLQRYPHAMVIVDFRELRTIVTSSEAALHQLKTLMSGLFKQPLRTLSCEHTHVSLACHRGIELTLRHGHWALAEELGAHTLGIRHIL